MKLIIEIPEEKYKWIKKNNPNADEKTIIGAIVNGTPYPKGEWIETGHINLRQCSNCSSQWGIYSIEDFDFCPSCGVQIREVIKNEGIHRH